jgi:hypothetical protein
MMPTCFSYSYASHPALPLSGGCKDRMQLLLHNLTQPTRTSSHAQTHTWTPSPSREKLLRVRRSEGHMSGAAGSLHAGRRRPTAAAEQHAWFVSSSARFASAAHASVRISSAAAQVSGACARTHARTQTTHARRHTLFWSCAQVPLRHAPRSPTHAPCTQQSAAG